MTEAKVLSATRKDDHVRLALKQAESRHLANAFDDLKFVHHALGAKDVKNVSLETDVLGALWQTPLYINAMTGGSSATEKINRSLANVARETGLAIASGSMSAIFKDAETEKSFGVLRDTNPDGFIFANLNANASLKQAERAIKLLDADALQIHVNSVQELVMVEGDREFGHWKNNIRTIVESVEIPVVVKEVGFGISYETALELLNLGVVNIDTAGSGGTNFARIEQDRAGTGVTTGLIDWGLETAASVIEVDRARSHGVKTVFASGGVRSPLDVVKSLALGATAVGVAGGFLRTLNEYGENALIEEIGHWNQSIQTILALLGAETPGQAVGAQLLISGKMREFCEQRKIDTNTYALRGREG